MQKLAMNDARQKLFVCLDTNILVRIASQGIEGCELSRWEKLKEHVGSGSVTLIVPEVVLLEFTTMLDSVPTRMSENCAELRKMLQGDKVEVVYSEIRDVKSELESVIERCRLERPDAYKQRWESINQFLTSNQPVLVPFNEKVLVRYRKRAILKRFPKSSSAKKRNEENDRNDRWDNDACIIDSMVEFFSGRKLHECQLAICTENVAHFGVQSEKGTSLHPEFRHDLPTTTLYANLASLLDVVRKGEPPPELSQDELRQLEESAAEEAKWISEGQDESPMYLAANRMARSAYWSNAQNAAKRLMNAVFFYRSSSEPSSLVNLHNSAASLWECLKTFLEQGAAGEGFNRDIASILPELLKVIQYTEIARSAPYLEIIYACEDFVDVMQAKCPQLIPRSA
jgi:hypothetical protein